MSEPSEIREFLVSRRAKITPETAGLPTYGTNRRVKGLRREEVALLAGVSVEYYTRIERGSVRGVSDDVLEGIVRALQLDEAERLHLFDLVRNASANRTRARRPGSERVRASVQQVLDAITAPAYLRNERLDILAANALGEALYAPVYAFPGEQVNTARFVFLDPSAADFFLDWPKVANDAVGILRAAAGRDPHDRRLTDLIGELSTRSEFFRTHWAAHDVKLHQTGIKRFHHPIVGEITLGYEAFELPADPGQRLNIYTAEPASPSQEALDLLASWITSPAALPAEVGSGVVPRTEA